MSRLGDQPVAVPAGVSVAIDGARVTIKGPKGEMSLTCPDGIAAALNGAILVVSRRDNSQPQKRQHGTTRSLLAGIVTGVHEGYVKVLEIQGVGFRAQAQGQKLTMSLGYSHPIEFQVPAGLKLEVSDPTTVRVSGCDKHLVGETAAQIRNFYRAEPYKGKGVRYKGEHVRRKAGKTVA